MKPPAFEYKAPDFVAEAVSLLTEHGYGAKLLAGGQSLVPTMNFRLAAPTILIDLNNIPELDYIQQGDGEVRIGAMTRQRTVEKDEVIKDSVPLLHEAVPYIAHPQIRNRGTIGGSIVHADPASELPVVALTLGAKFVVRNADGERTVPVKDFFFGFFMTAVEPHELLTEIILPEQPPLTGSAFMEISRRQGDYAMMGVAVQVSLDEDGAYSDAKLVYLNAGPSPTPAPQASQMLIGEEYSEELATAAAHKAAEEEIDPEGSVHATPAYQKHLARVLTERALAQATARAQEGQPA